MQRLDQLTPHPTWLRGWGSVLALIAGIRSRIASAMNLPRRRDKSSRRTSQTTPALKIAGYSLVLMDSDGQVIWTREWDSGGVFEFGPRQRLWVFCGFTNHSECETEISEYEIELMSEDGLVVERFGDSFGDSVIIPPGESKHFPADWRM
ncbi:MAG: hypothetical protein AABO57_04810 [Acidobacteriota bacterium]